MKALRISRPSVVRTGMFCRLGSALEMRPVAVTHCLKLVWTRPSGAMDFSNPSTKVASTLATNRYSMIRDTMGCLSLIASRVSLSVEYPVLFFFWGGSPSFSNRMVPSCLVDRMLNRSPACS